MIIGGGTGGFAAAVSALKNGLKVILVEETDWIGGQFTQQGLSCPDEHQWIEQFGATEMYRGYRNSVRDYYKRFYPLTVQAKKSAYLNPGDGVVSALCHEPKVSLAVFESMIAPYLSSGKLVLLLNFKAVSADVDSDKIRTLLIENRYSKHRISLEAPFFVDATELGDLLPMTGTEYRTGAESREETKELHAAEEENPEDVQAFTYCFAMDYVKDADFTIDKPEGYDFWHDYIPDMTPPWPGRLLQLSYSNPKNLERKPLGFDPSGAPTGEWLNLWNYRRIINEQNFLAGTYSGGMTIVNWPQNDFFPGNLIGATEENYNKYIKQSKQLSLSLFYWLQTEAPRPDGGIGWKGLRLRGDIMGTTDGLAKFPYIRESRRIKAVFTVKEEHVGVANRIMVAGKELGKKSADFYDSVGIGYYHIDLHPSSANRNYIDFDSLPFQIPLGSLLPVRMKNLLPACKNIGTTHITNGCYRLHPVEWNIGESVGLLASFCLKNELEPHAVRENKLLLKDFQDFIRTQGIETHWPKEI